MFQIANYEKYYQPLDKSGRILKHADYVKLPVNPKGDGLEALLEHRRGLEVFGIWCLLLEKATAQKPELRGQLLNHKDEPASIEEIAKGISLRKKVRLVEYALSLLVSMDWLEGDIMSPKRETSCAPKCSVVECSGEKCNKHIYMEFVKLTSDEHSKLLEQFGEAGLKERIAALNNYIGKIGVRAAAKKYKSHYFTILSWERKDGPQATHKKTKLFPISGKTCGERGCGLPAVYKSSGEYSHYYCTNHMPEEVKEKYE